MNSEYLILAATLLTSVAIITLASLRGWQSWLTLKSRELEMHRPEIEHKGAPGAGRIEIADLRERVRKLEAIAAGVDL